MILAPITGRRVVILPTLMTDRMINTRGVFLHRLIGNRTPPREIGDYFCKLLVKDAVRAKVISRAANQHC